MTALEEIKKALEGVTPGPWEVYSEKVADKAAAIAESAYQVEHTEPFVGEIFMLNAGGKCPALTGCGPCSEANARYIAAVNPAAISELLSTLESLQRENAILQERTAEYSTIAAKLHDREKAREAEQKSCRDAIARAEAAEAEVKRLQAEIERKSSMPGDHRYWEGRYRDEAAENEKLREALEPFRTVSKDWVDENGWTDVACQKDRIVDWFGPSDFRALASTGGEHHGN